MTLDEQYIGVQSKYEQYIDALRKPIIKICKLEFLNIDDSVRFVLDNNYRRERNKSYLKDGALSVSLNNGVRRTANIIIENEDGFFDFDINNHIWFGSKVRLSMGILLENEEPYYFAQGIFYIRDPQKSFNPSNRNATLQLVDKWAFLDGSLHGFLDYIFEVPLNSHILEAMQSILHLDRGNGTPIDATAPLFTHFYNDKTVVLMHPSVIPSGYAQFNDIQRTLAGGNIVLPENFFRGVNIGSNRALVIPRNARQFGVIDINAHTVQPFGAESMMTNKYNGHIDIGGGRILAIPNNADDFAVVTTATQAITTIGIAVEEDAEEIHIFNKFSSAVSLGGNMAIAIPYNAHHFMHVNITSQRSTPIGTSPDPNTGKYTDGIVMGDGRIIAVPFNARSFAIISSGSEGYRIDTENTNITESGRYIQGIRLSPTRALMIPFSARQFTIVDMNVDNTDAVLYRHLNVERIGDIDLTPGKYIRGVDMGGGIVLAIPYNAHQFALVNTNAGTVTLIGDIDEMREKYTDAVSLGGGNVLLIPYNATQFAIINVNTHAITRFGSVDVRERKYSSFVSMDAGRFLVLPHNIDVQYAIANTGDNTVVSFGENGTLIQKGTPIERDIQLPVGSRLPVLLTPYTARKEGTSDTLASLMLELNTMLAGHIGYNANGQLQFDPSQDDVLDAHKPVLWNFALHEPEFLGASYQVRNSEIYNDVVVTGATIAGITARARVTNRDVRSPFSVLNIGQLKTMPRGDTTSEQYVTNQQCFDLGLYFLKMHSIMRSNVTIRCSQMFHLYENAIVTLYRPDRNNALERHLITGYSIPIGLGEMTINCASVNDIPDLNVQ